LRFKVTAKQSGNSVQYEVEAADAKEALLVAKVEARKIFDYQLGDEMPTVSVKPVKNKEDVE
jgi:hypothetical protein